MIRDAKESKNYNQSGPMIASTRKDGTRVSRPYFYDKNCAGVGGNEARNK
jgi:hypothetical protein